MSATIKRYDCTNGRAQHCYGCYQMDEEELGDYVLHADHLASHAYDEEKERALFEAWLESSTYLLAKTSTQASMRTAWLACAKSRAKAAGCE